MKQTHEIDWPDAWTKASLDLGTQELPDDVVRQEFVIGVWCFTAPDDSRHGMGGVGWTFAGIANKPLTEDEAKYVAAALRLYADRLVNEPNFRLAKGGDTAIGLQPVGYVSDKII